MRFWDLCGCGQALPRGVVASALGLASCTGTHAVEPPGRSPSTPVSAAPAQPQDVLEETGFQVRCWVPTLGAHTQYGQRFVLADAGANISVAAGASAAVRAAARTLAEKLSEITGGHYEVRDAEAAYVTTGIVLGTVTELPRYRSLLGPLDWRDREAFLVESESSRLLLVAATDQGIEAAVWDFLHQLGYRHYFPGKVWKVVPHLPRLEMQTRRICRPAFIQRRIVYGGGDWPENKNEFDEWSRENRLGGLPLEISSASYQAIIRRNQAVFAGHPEYLGRAHSGPSSKFCVLAPGLIDLVTRFAVGQFEARPDRWSISLSPSDGGGWEGCPQDAALGSPSNRAVTLANAVAQAVNQHATQERFVGMYAYHQHAAPPTLRIDPSVVILVATAYLPFGLDVSDALAGWRAAGQREGGTLMGVREYYSINALDRDRPGIAVASSPGEVAQSLADYHARGARFFVSEAGDGWGPHGLGYWVAAGSLWTADAPAPAASYVDDFLKKAFGKAATLMQGFYARIDRTAKPLLCAELIGDLYRILDAARQIEQAPDVTRRIHHLAAYLRYLDLWLDYEFAEPNQSQGPFERLMRYTYSIRKDHVVHSFGLQRDLALRRKGTAAPEQDETASAATDGPKDIGPTEASLDAQIRLGASRPGLPPTSVPDPPESLVRLLPRAPPKGESPSRIQLRGRQRFHLLFDGAQTLTLEVQAGVIRARGHAQLTFCGSSGELSCQTQLIPADGSSHEISFRVPQGGHYSLTSEDWRQGIVLSWPHGTPMTMVATQAEPPALSTRWTLYLYIPRGTRELVLYSGGGPGVLRDARGKIVHTFQRTPGVVRVPVAAGQDEQCWEFRSNAGFRLPLNVPPWLAASPDELLLPARLRASVEQSP